MFTSLRLVWEQTVLPILARRTKLDLLHSLHYTRPLVLPCASVVTLHDMTFFLFPHLHTLPKRLFFPMAIRYSARVANALIADSESTRHDVIRLLRVQPGKTTTIPLGVTSEYRPVSNRALLEPIRQKCALPEKFLLYVGTVEPRKNLPALLRAYRSAVDAGCSLPLVVVGRLGWMYDEVFRMVEALGLRERLKFTGYIPTQDLPLIYNLAEIFIYPSMYEGFGLPPLEAMACGTPVITTAVSSMPEHVGKAGVLVPPDDEGALARAILGLVNDDELRRRLAVEGPRQAAQFTWARTARETLQVYRRVLGLA